MAANMSVVTVTGSQDEQINANQIPNFAMENEINFAPDANGKGGLEVVTVNGHKPPPTTVPCQAGVDCYLPGELDTAIISGKRTMFDSVANWLCQGGRRRQY